MIIPWILEYLKSKENNLSLIEQAEIFLKMGFDKEDLKVVYVNDTFEVTIKDD
jgi:hypothetical protein